MTGVLPDHVLKRVLGTFITGIGEEYVNPASVDLPLSDEAYCLECSFLPQGGQTVRSLLPAVGTKFNLSNRLEVGVSYLIRIGGEFRLPPEVYGYVNPKSSTGRNNLLCRVVADGISIYDALHPAGWSGEVWVLVRPESFPVLLTPGQAVTQLRLFDGKSFLDELDVTVEAEKHGLAYHPNGTRFELSELQRHADSLLLTLMVEPGMSAWECRGLQKTLDFGNVYDKGKDTGGYNATDFFDKVEARNGFVDLRKGGFYILSTYEHISLSPNTSAELRAIDPRFGEFRSHSAGYIDPGWGWGINGEVPGRPITLEINPHENIRIYNRQTVARIRFERMKSAPERSYDAAASNYTKQTNGAQLSKHFKCE